jgi:hypothetical protein
MPRRAYVAQGTGNIGDGVTREDGRLSFPRGCREESRCSNVARSCERGIPRETMRFLGSGQIASR